MSLIHHARQLFSLWWSIWLLMVIVCVYPCFKLCLGCEPVDEVASRRINERIHEIVLEKNLFGSVPPTSGGVAASQIAVEMVLEYFPLNFVSVCVMFHGRPCVDFFFP
jgi:hypothetical protein